MQRLHTLVGLRRDATPAALKRAYQRTVLQCHPDLNKDATADAFMAVQAAWEEYERSLRTRPRDEPRSPWAADAPQPDMEMVLMIFETSPSWSKSSMVHHLRESVASSVRAHGRHVFGADFPSHANVRRVEYSGARVDVHMHTRGPSHRDSICGMVKGNSAFMERLHGTLDGAGWPVAEMPLALKACLPYTLPAPPAPTAPVVRVPLEGE